MKTARIILATAAGCIHPCLVVHVISDVFAHSHYSVAPDTGTWLTWVLVAYVTLIIRQPDKLE